jgi:hypothetical protein
VSTVPAVRTRPLPRTRLRIQSVLTQTLIWVRASSLARFALLLIVLGCCGYGLAVEWPGVRAALGLMHWYSLAGSVAAAMAGGGAMMLAWRALLAALR